MPSTTAATPPPSEPSIDLWESSFGDRIVESTRVRRDAWLGGCVHVIDADPEPDPIQTGLVDEHQILLFETEGHLVEAHEHAPPHVERVHPGHVNVLSAAFNRESMTARWTDPIRAVSVFLDRGILMQACEAADLDYPAVEWREVAATPDPFLASVVRQMAREVEANGPHGRAYAEALMQSLAAHVLRHYTIGEKAPSTPPGELPGYRVNRVCDYVEEHLDQDLSLDDLADTVDMNPYHFLRLFKAATGITPYQYVIQQRIERAKVLLKTTEWTVLRVGLEVGYDSPSHFSRLFKREVGVSPSVYRRGC
jgi:AraC family transcriptional regulator